MEMPTSSSPRVLIILLYLVSCGTAWLLLDGALGVRQVVSNHVSAIWGREVPIDTTLVRQAALGTFGLGFLAVLLVTR